MMLGALCLSRYKRGERQMCDGVKGHIGPHWSVYGRRVTWWMDSGFNLEQSLTPEDEYWVTLG